MTINLIPPKLKLQQGLKNTLNQTVFGLSMIFIMLAIMTLALYAYNTSVQSDLKNTGNKLTDQEKRLKDYQNIENSVKSVNKKLTSIDDILKTKSSPSGVITNISSFTPKDVQIKSMDLNIDTNNIIIQGIAVTRKDIALFKEKLEQNNFQNVTFASSSYNQNSNDYTFSLTLGLENAK